MLTLYADHLRSSPFVFTAYVALIEKQLPFRIVDVRLDNAEQRLPEYLAQSLTGQVPALVHDDFWLSESIAIAEYLAETFPYPTHPRLFPGNLQQRARCRQIMLWLRSRAIDPLRRERSSTRIFDPASHDPPAPLSHTADAQTAYQELLRVLSLVLRPGQRTLCDDWCIADAELAFVLQRLISAQDELPDWLGTYAQHQWTRPSVQAFLRLPRKTTEAH